MRATKTTKSETTTKPITNLPKSHSNLDTSFQTPIEIALKIDENGMTSLRNLYEFLELRNRHEIKCIISSLVLYSSMIRLARLFQYQFYSSYCHLLLTRSGIYLYLQRI